MWKYLLLVLFIFLFKVLPGYEKYKNSENYADGLKSIGYWNMLEGISFIFIILLGGLIAHCLQ